jgi:hypothetical protein
LPLNQQPGQRERSGNQESIQPGKKCLPADAEISAAEVVLGEKFACRAEAADDLHISGRRLPACTEEFSGLVFFKGMTFIVLAVRAVFPAKLPVLFGIRDNRFIGNDHGKKYTPIIYRSCYFRLDIRKGGGKKTMRSLRFFAARTDPKTAS